MIPVTKQKIRPLIALVFILWLSGFTLPKAVAQLAANDICQAPGITVADTCAWFQVSLDSATNSNLPEVACVNYNGPDVWYRFTLDQPANVFLTTRAGTTNDAIVEVYQAAVCTDSLVLVACNDDAETLMPAVDLFNAQAGTYWLRLLSWDNAGTFDVCVTQAPAVVNSFNVCQNRVQTLQSTTLQFEGQALPNDLFIWFFDGGQANPGQGPGPHTVQWSTAGTKTVGLIMERNGKQQPLFTQQVQVSTSAPQPMLTNLADTLSFCTGQPVQVALTLDGFAPFEVHYQYNNGTGIVQETTTLGQQGQCSPNAYSLEVPATALGQPLTITQIKAGNQSTFTSINRSVQLNALPIAAPTATFALSADTIVAGTEVTVTYTGTGAATNTYYWNFGGGSIVSGQGAGPYTLAFEATGNYTIDLTVADSLCSSVLQSTTLVVTGGSAANDEPCQATFIDQGVATCSAPIQGSTAGSTLSGGIMAGAGCTEAPGTDVWYRFALSQVQNVRVAVQGVAGSAPLVQAFRADSCNSTLQAMDCAGTDLNMAFLNPGEYWLRVGAQSGNEIDFTLCLDRQDIPPPTVAFVQETDRLVCPGDSILIFVELTGRGAWELFIQKEDTLGNAIDTLRSVLLGSGLSSSPTTVPFFVKPDQTTVYNLVALSDADHDAVVVSGSKTVSVLSVSPGFDFVDSTISLTDTLQINYTGSQTGLENLRWLADGGTRVTNSTRFNPLYTFLAPGTYEVTLEAQAANCPTIDRITKSITVTGDSTVVNDDICNAIELPVVDFCISPFEVAATTVFATNDSTFAAPTCSSREVKDVWFSFHNTERDFIQIRTEQGTSTAGFIELFMLDSTQTCTDSLRQLFCRASSVPSISATLDAGFYYVRYSDTFREPGSFRICVSRNGTGNPLTATFINTEDAEICQTEEYRMQIRLAGITPFLLDYKEITADTVIFRTDTLGSGGGFSTNFTYSLTKQPEVSTLYEFTRVRDAQDTIVGKALSTFFRVLVAETPFPEADFEVDTSLVPLGDTVLVTFNGVASPEATFLWNFDRSAVAVPGQGPGPHKVVYTERGSKSIKLTVLEETCISQETRQDVEVVAPPTLRIENTTDTLCNAGSYNNRVIVNGYGPIKLITVVQPINGPADTINQSLGSNFNYLEAPFFPRWTLDTTSTISIIGISDALYPDTIPLFDNTMEVTIDTRERFNLDILPDTNTIAQADTLTVSLNVDIGPDEEVEWDWDGAKVVEGQGAGPYRVHWFSGGNKQLSVRILRGTGCNTNFAFEVIRVNGPARYDEPCDARMVELGQSVLADTDSATASTAYPQLGSYSYSGLRDVWFKFFVDRQQDIRVQPLDNGNLDRGIVEVFKVDSCNADSANFVFIDGQVNFSVWPEILIQQADTGQYFARVWHRTGARGHFGFRVLGTPTPTASFADSALALCANANNAIPVTLTGVTPITIDYSYAGASQTFRTTATLNQLDNDSTGVLMLEVPDNSDSLSTWVIHTVADSLNTTPLPVDDTLRVSIRQVDSIGILASATELTTGQSVTLQANDPNVNGATYLWYTDGAFNQQGRANKLTGPGPHEVFWISQGARQVRLVLQDTLCQSESTVNIAVTGNHLYDQACQALALPLNQPDTLLLNNNGATADSLSTPCYNDLPQDIWFKVQLDAPRNLTLQTFGGRATDDMVMQVLTGDSCDVESLQHLACNDDNGNDAMPALELKNLAAGTYYVRLWDFFAGSGTTFGIKADTTAPPPPTARLLVQQDSLCALDGTLIPVELTGQAPFRLGVALIEGTQTIVDTTIVNGNPFIQGPQTVLLPFTVQQDGMLVLKTVSDSLYNTPIDVFDTTTLTVIADATPQVSFSLSTDTVSIGDTLMVTFTGQAANGANYFWSFGNGQPLNGFNSGSGPFEVVFGQPGTEEISLIVSQFGCNSQSVVFTDTVNVVPVPFDNPCSANALTFAGTVQEAAFSTLGATNSQDIPLPPCDSLTNPHDVWAALELEQFSDSAVLVLSTAQSIDPGLELLSANNCNGTFTTVDCQTEVTMHSNGTRSVTIRVNSLDPGTYYARIWGQQEQQGSFTLQYVARNGIPAPTAAFTSNDTTICQGQPLQLQAQLTGTGPWQLVYSAEDDNGLFVDTLSLGQLNEQALAVQLDFDPLESNTTFVLQSIADEVYSFRPVNDTLQVEVKDLPAQPVINVVGDDGSDGSITLTTNAAEGYQWFLDGTAIEGATNQQETFEVQGSYTVQVTVNGCQSPVSAAFAYTITGIDQWLDQQLSVFPNPGKDYLYVEWTGQAAAQPLHFTLYALAGNQVPVLVRKHEGRYRLAIEALPQGMYWLRIEGPEGYTLRKVMKQ